MAILFLCVANSARSQIAEGLARQLALDWVFYSAGSVPTVIRPEAIAVLAEVGIDASKQFSKGLSDVPVSQIGTVITLCAEESCPVGLAHAERLHWPIPDPHDLDGFRAAREEIKVRLIAFFGEQRATT